MSRRRDIDLLVAHCSRLGGSWGRPRRADRVAADLGVGLVAMTRSHNVSSWTTVRKAERRSVTTSDRAALAKATGTAADHAAERPGNAGSCAV